MVIIVIDIFPRNFIFLVKKIILIADTTSSLSEMPCCPYKRLKKIKLKDSRTCHVTIKLGL